MAALIVGGDYLDGLKQEIAEFGITRIRHWNGRKQADSKKSIPKDTRLVVIMCDYVSHNLSKKVKQDATRVGLPVVYCKRSLGELRLKLAALARRASSVEASDGSHDAQ